MDERLRILCIVNLPWDPRLGAARVYVDLAEQWKKAGHIVDKFCLTDAFPKPTNSRGLRALRQVLFPRRAARFVREHAAEFDLIDALIGTVPFPKSNLRFNGLLVARSVGFHRAYDQFSRFSQKKWSNQPRGKFLGRFFYRWVSHRLLRDNESSLRHCDLINLINEDEIPFLRHPPAIDKPAIVEPNGLTEKESAALARAMESPEKRLGAKEICFVGMWGLRKGSRDWPELVNRIRQEMPEARFNFLGTMTDDQTVHNDLRLPTADGIRILSMFDREQLPRLLGRCAVGLFPSYIEGFGLAVLEQLACGIPSIAYDVSGPRQILRSLATTLLVPAGDTTAMAERALNILNLDVHQYATLSAQCRSVAEQFRWEKIATDTIDEYREALKTTNRHE
ncbi:MAG: glycosyltransferase family 4 protein [Chthoniobacterales bacterium]